MGKEELEKEGLIICHPTDAYELAFDDIEIMNSLVISPAVRKGNPVLVNKDDFVDWAYGADKPKKETDLDRLRLLFDDFIYGHEISKNENPAYWGEDDEKYLQMFYEIREILERIKDGEKVHS